jgi:exodeoxyribonuclease VII large subunit
LALAAAGRAGVERRRAALRTAAARLDALSPLATLGRGYAVARGADGRTLTGVADFVPGTAFALTLRDGGVDATTVAVRPEARS